MRSALLFLLLLPAFSQAAETTPLATRGTATVTLDDIDARAESIPPEQRAGVFDSPKRIETIVSGLLLNRQLANDARKRGLAEDPRVQREILLATEGVLARHAATVAFESAKVDFDALAHEVYLSDRDSFDQQETLTVQHVLITAATLTKDEARRKADATRVAALAAGADFAQIATASSEDNGSREKGGLIPEFARGAMDKSFEDAAFALTTPGQISPVVESSFGFHVIKLIARKPARKRPFEEVKPELVAKIRQEHSARAMREYIDTLRNMPLDLDEEGIVSLRARYPVEMVAAPTMPFEAEAKPDPQEPAQD